MTKAPCEKKEENHMKVEGKPGWNLSHELDIKKDLSGTRTGIGKRYLIRVRWYERVMVRNG